jgi:SRI (Set2 Rpb1 interacting) domain
MEFKLAMPVAPQPTCSLQVAQEQPSMYDPRSQEAAPSEWQIETAKAKKKKIGDIIAAANAAVEVEAAQLAAALAVEPPPEVIKKKASSSKKSKEEKEANKEKRLLKLVGAVVVKCMSKYASKMDNDVFKKYAKEVRAFVSSLVPLHSALFDFDFDFFLFYVRLTRFLRFAFCMPYTCFRSERFPHVRAL